jgi:hypothetical protein
VSLDAIARGQAFAESRMFDTCVIRRVTGQVTDPDTNEVVDTLEDVYEGRCRFQQSDIDPTQATVGEDFTLLQRMVVQLPMAAIGFQTDDVVECLTSHDPDLPGRRFFVRALAHKTEATARRLQLRERTD